MARPSRHIDAAVEAIDAALLDYEGQHTTEAEYTTDFHPDRCARCQRHATDDGRDMCQPCVDWLNGADIDDPAERSALEGYGLPVAIAPNVRRRPTDRLTFLTTAVADTVTVTAAAIALPLFPWQESLLEALYADMPQRRVQGLPNGPRHRFVIEDEVWNRAADPGPTVHRYDLPETERLSPVERVQQMRQRQREARERGLRTDHRRGRQ